MSPLGISQARVAAERLSDTVGRVRILSSPARRTHETALVIGERLGAAVTVEHGLYETGGAGRASPATRERVQDLWRRGDRTARYPDGERSVRRWTGSGAS